MPDRLCVESKSLKFYLASYRNERAFNEAVTNRILDDFVKACAPREAIVTAQFSARGGIALTVRAEYPDKKPEPRREMKKRRNDRRTPKVAAATAQNIACQLVSIRG